MQVFVSPHHFKNNAKQSVTSPVYFSSPQQTSITLNERFRILKDQRAATAHSSKGSRFVTVG